MWVWHWVLPGSPSFSIAPTPSAPCSTACVSCMATGGVPPRFLPWRSSSCSCSTLSWRQASCPLPARWMSLSSPPYPKCSSSRSAPRPCRSSLPHHLPFMAICEHGAKGPIWSVASLRECLGRAALVKRQLLAVLIVTGSTAALAQEPDAAALAAIDSCVARLDPELDVGFDRIAARCPELARTLEHSGWAAWLPRGWKESRNDLSAGSLTELRAVVIRELRPPQVARTPQVARLHEILAEMGQTPAAGSEEHTSELQ